jgi:hypothetical protein
MHNFDPGAILKLYKIARSEMTVDKSNNSTSISTPMIGTADL